MRKLSVVATHPDGSTSYHSPNRARRYIRDGRAGWTDSSHTAIRFDVAHHAHQAVVASAEQLIQRRSRGGYDHVDRVLRRSELKRIPFVGDIERLMRGKAQTASV